MRWEEERQSDNVEDIRSTGGGGRRIALAGGGIGTIVIALLVFLFGGNLRDVLGVLGGAVGQQTQQVAPAGGQTTLTPADQAAGKFASAVLASTEDVWGNLFRAKGRTYRQPKMVLYTDHVRSACGATGPSTGPFYCPADEKVYLDLRFLDKLQRRLGAPGDFAVAYVIAHEVGHHVQKVLGIMDKAEAARSRMTEAQYNQVSVRLELQADFFAGVWAHHADKMRHILQEGDLDEALNAASAVGDDHIQKMQQGYVVPDAFTHGTSTQRRQWFLKGFQTGDITQGDTFAGI